MTAVKTDLGTTRDSARRIRVEKDSFSGLTTNVQTSLQNVAGSVALGLAPRIPASSGAITLQNTDIEVGIHTASVAPTVTLPNAAQWQAQNGGLELTIFDDDGHANTNNISFALNGTDTFNYAVTPKITANYGLLKLRPIGNPATGWYVRGIN